MFSENTVEVTDINPKAAPFISYSLMLNTSLCILFSLIEVDNEDEEEEDDDYDGEGEELDAEDIRSLISGRLKQPSISVEEYKGEAGRTSTGTTGGAVDSPGSITTLLKAQSNAMKIGNADKSKNGGVRDTGGVRDEVRDGDGVLESTRSEEISMDEVFKLLCGGQEYVTKERLLEWDYLQEIMQVRVCVCVYMCVCACVCVYMCVCAM